MADDAPQRVQEQVRQQIINIGGIVDGVAERVKGIVNDALKAVFDPLGAALQAQISVFGDLVGGLLQNLATPEDIGKQFSEWWASNATNPDFGPGSVADWLGKSVPAALAEWIVPHVADAAEKWWLTADTLEPNRLDPEQVIEWFNSVPLPVRFIFQSFSSAFLLVNLLQTINFGPLAAIQQASLQETLPTPLSPADVATAVVQSQVGQDWANGHVARSGLTPELFDIMVKTAGEPPGGQQVLELWRRGVLTEAEVNQALAESRLKNKYIDPVKRLATVLPSPGDLIRFLVRDALDDTVAQSLQLDTDFDRKYNADLFFQVGLDEQLARYFWRSHWQLPSPGQLYEMFHRTADAESQWSEPVTLPSGRTVFRLLSRDQIKETLKIDDHLIPFLDKYVAISFNPPTRIDARRMYMADVFTDDDLYRAFIDEGYTPEFSGKMLQWMQQAKADAQKKQAEKTSAPITNALRKAYNDGLIGAGELKQRAVALGYDGDAVDVWTAQLDAEREANRANKLRDGLHRLYLAGFISEDDAGNRLQSEGFTSAEWMRLRDDWRIDKEFRDLSDDQKRAHELTKTNLLAAFKDQLIQEPELRRQLQSMGYHDDEIDVWVALTKFEGSQRVAEIAREGTHEDYVDQLIDAAEARNQLAQIGTPSEAIEAYLRRWTAERRRKTPQIGVGQVEAAFKNATLPEDEARTLLSRLRYPDDEVDVLIGAWSKDLSISEQRLQLEQERFAAQQQRAAQQSATQQQQFEQRQAAQQSRQQQQEAFTQAQQARQLEAQLQRQTAGFEQAAQRQATSIAAASARQDKALAVAQQKEQAQLAERDKALAQARDLAAQAQAAQNARQQATLQAAADRQQKVFEQQDKLYQQRVQDRVAQEQRAQAYKIAAEQRQQQYQQAKEQRANATKVQTELRGQRRELEKELRTQGYALAKEQRSTSQRIATEQRASDRRAALATATAQAESLVANTRLQQQQVTSQSAQDILNGIEQQVQAQIAALPNGA